MNRSFVLTAGIFIALFSAAQQTNLSYTEVSGLSYPDWDGGRTELEFADINADGHVDILTIGDHGNPYINTAQHGIIVYFGDGEGNFTVAMEGDFGYGGIATGDVNNDGWMDVGYGMHHDYSSTDLGDQLLEVALGNGTGVSWTPWDDGLATAGEDWGMFGTDFGDVDNDGDLDIGSVSFGCCAGVHVYLNNMDGTWQHSFGFLDGNSDETFEFGDINNDGFLDIATGHSAGNIWFGDGTGDFTLMDNNLPYDPGLRYGISLGDIDGDGGKDVAFVNSSGGVEAWRWSESLNSWSDMSGDLPPTGNYELSQLDDMNGDGKIDLFVFGGGTGILWLGDGEGNWQQDASVSTPPAGNGQALRTGGDIDHNGKPDIALVAEEGSWPSYSNRMRLFRESSPVFVLNIKASYPKGGEYLWQNCLRNIEWLSAVPPGDSSWVDLSYSVTGDQGPWYTIATGVPNNGCYQWLVPLENSLNCHVRYTVHTQSGSQSSFINSEPFTITDGTASTGESSLNSFTWTVTPNPFNNIITVNIKGISGKRTVIRLSDMNGRQVKTAVIDRGYSVVTVETSDLRPGTYLLTASTEHGIIGRRKVVKME